TGGVWCLRDCASSPESYTLSLHDALPIWAISVAIIDESRCPVRDQPARQLLRVPRRVGRRFHRLARQHARYLMVAVPVARRARRSEEHTSELQSRENLVCRLLLEKKNHMR